MLAAALLPAPTLFASDVEPVVVVVVGDKTPIKEISLSQLRRAFLGLPTVVDGVRLLPLNQKAGSPERARFDRLVLGLSPDQVGAFWVDRRIRDQSPPPRTVPSPDLAAKVVASLPGAITYLPRHALNPRLTVVTVEGKGREL